MINPQQNTFQNATGKIDYTLMNDYMFRAVLQENRTVLQGLICSLLHLKSENIQSVTILNPIELGETIDDKTYILDIKILLNNAEIINLELQVAQQSFWCNRSLAYLCSIFSNLESGEDYSQIKPAYHIGILNFTPFPNYPEFFATYKMMNAEKHYIYNDNFTLNVLDLTQIELATAEDKAYKIDDWAKIFKAKTWEDLKMLAQKDNALEQTCETIFKFNQDDKMRYLCEAREEGQRIIRTYESLNKQYLEELAQKDSAINEMSSAIAKKDSTINEMNSTINEMSSTIAILQAKLAEYEK